MVKNYVPSDLLKDTFEHREIRPPAFSTVYLKRNFLGRVIQIGTAPTLIYDGVRAQNLMITNPAPIPGGIVTNTGLVTQQAALVAAGNSQAAPIALANYLSMHLFLNVTAIAVGDTWDFVLVVQDPVTGQWVDSQVLIAAVTPAMVATWTNTSLYAFIGQMGVATQFAVRWVLVGGAGPMSFTLSYALKEGLFGSPGGISQVIYIISSSGGQVTAGYPLLEGAEKVFQVAEGTQLWAIAQVATPIRVFELV